ncbi:GNAT family N-acetyltransferase [Tissierella carlieri]|nr:GNAT family N-acetyltransferase [Tissierella carlieri]
MLTSVEKGKNMKIKVKEMSDIDYEKVNKLIDFEDADAEFLTAYNNREENIYCLYNYDKLVGIAQIITNKRAFLYIFINPSYRGNGIGFNALKLCEEKLYENDIEQIMTTYRIDNPYSKAFANKHGYTRKFSSVYMRYSGSQFDVQELFIRNYCDDDYESAHEMYAKAFHEMRISVGDFPDSVIEQPNDKMRQYWAETSNERLVYIRNSEIVGYAHIDGNEIGSVSVKSQKQGQGIGRSFVKYICNKILAEGNEAVFLYCVAGNRAKSLYDSLGFQEIYTCEYATKLNSLNI